MVTYLKTNARNHPWRTLCVLLTLTLFVMITWVCTRSGDAAISADSKNKLGVALTSQTAATEICDRIDIIENLTQTEVDVLDGVTAGTGAASKAVVLDSSGNLAWPASGSLRIAAVAGTGTLAGIPVTIIFEPDTGETLSYTVPTGYDLRVLNCIGWKTAAAGDHADDQWDLQNNDGSAANIFDTEELNAIADKEMVQFDNLDDAEDEVEAGDTLDLVAGEDADDDGADGIVIVTGILKTAD